MYARQSRLAAHPPAAVNAPARQLHSVGWRWNPQNQTAAIAPMTVTAAKMWRYFLDICILLFDDIHDFHFRAEHLPGDHRQRPGIFPDIQLANKFNSVIHFVNLLFLFIHAYSAVFFSAMFLAYAPFS
jgi:hypothetical protein